MAVRAQRETGPLPALTRPAPPASVVDVSQSANFSARRHVDLRRYAGALCAFDLCGC
ncbi:putative leader peptide [Streptomyces lavendofoliae]|uniref:putative leader peptide n=1 Tax=Streptomyces lavendofoliae TaxID=67314 RepID=UPI0035710C2D